MRRDARSAAATSAGSVRPEAPKCSLPESVAQMIHLLVTTGFGECRNNPTFGSEIWEKDFENIVNTQLYRETLRKSIQSTIEKHEPRLTGIRVDIQMDQVDYTMFSRRTKSRTTIRTEMKGNNCSPLRVHKLPFLAHE